MNHTLSLTKFENNHPLHPEYGDQYDEQQKDNGQLQEVFHIIDNAVFTSLEHEIIGHLSEYGIQEMNGFSVSFNFTIFKDEDDEKRNNNSDIFQTGTTAKKNLQVQLTPQLNIRIVYRIGKEKDYLFSQTSLKYNKNYYFCLTIEKSKDEQGKDIYNLAMYLNGIIQGIVSITIPIDLPSEQIFIGGSAVPIFKGEISDLVIVTRGLSMDEIQYISKQKNIPINDQQQRTVEILEDYQAIHHQTPEQKARIVLSPQQKHSLPLVLSKSHITFNQEKIQQDVSQLSEEEMQKKKLEQGIANLEELLLKDNVLNDKCRELSFSFKWVFTTLQQLSPPLLSKSDQSLAFTCLNRLISTDQIKSDEVYPLYIIELDRFLKVIKYAQLPLSKEDIILIGQTCGWLNTYKLEEENLTILGIIYDKFMISIRNACMSHQEIREIKRDCSNDPHHEEPQEGETYIFDSYSELLDACKEMEMTEEEARRYQYVGLSVRGVPFKGGRSKFCCTRDPRMQFYESILQRYPEFYSNPDICAQIYDEIGQGQEINLVNFSVYCTQVLQLFAQEEMEAEDLTENIKKIFLNFAFTDENVIYYKELETVLKTLYITVLYSNGENTIEVFPRSVKQRKLLWGYQDQPFYHEQKKQLGGLRFVNKDDLNFLSTEIKYVTPFYVEYYQRKEVKQWSIIGKTQQNLGNWSSGKIELSGDYQYQFYSKQKLKFQFMAFQDDQDAKLAQQLKCTIGQMIGNKSSNKQYKLDFSAKDVKGNLNLFWDIESSGENFVDYLLGGLQLNISFAVDWTASNGDKFSKDGLHSLGKKGQKPLNNYQQILQFLGQIFMPFEEDGIIPLWGFGADPNYVKYGFPDCFSMNGKENAECLGIQEMLEAYEFTHKQVELGTRTVFQPALAKMIEKVVKNPPKHSTYNFVVILADTENYDNQEVMDLLVEASEHPISFCVIGIGKEVFKDLLYLNDSDQIQNTQGKKCIRQCTQFIRYEDLQSKEQFAQTVLEKFQQQVKIYYKMHKVFPPNLVELKNGKTVMHFLHPERFEPKKEEINKDKKEVKKVAKKGKKGKKDDEEEKESVFVPKYAEVDLNQKEQPVQMRIFMTIQQIPENSYGGTYHRLFRNLNADTDELENIIPKQVEDKKKEEGHKHNHDKSQSQNIQEERKQLLAMIKFNPQDYNYKKDFLRHNEQINGFKFTYAIVSQIKSQLFKDNNQVIDRCNLTDIEPIYENVCRGYEWPLTLDEKEVLPVPCEQWNQGRLQIVIQRCVKCNEHQGTSWHDEADFADRFNAFGELFKSYFPNIELLSNYDKPNTLECFDVYIRGVGPLQERDNQGRIWLFRKQEKLSQFLHNFERRMLQPFDKLVLLSAGYADSIEMEKAQEHYFKNNFVPKKWNNCQEFPCEIPERQKDIQAAKDKAEQIPAGTKMICKNWGCGQQYEHSEDPISTRYACLHHPGSYQMGSIHGLWPESWTCCRESWGNQGCTKGKHRGVPEKKLTHLCLNRGEVNPKTGTPDSACGRQFSESGDNVECVYHRGYFRLQNKHSEEGQWTCCHDQIKNQTGCFSDTHKYAVWPDDEAKLYFVEKPQYNANWREDKVESFSKTATKSCVYRETVPYKPYVSTKTQQYHDRLANEYETRICLHHGCDPKNMKFREVENKQAKENRKFTCQKHPGLFDFGHSGFVKSVSEAIGENENALWKPHWSCCRKEWNAPGCTKTYHWGPVEQGMEPLKHGRWPSYQAMKYFKKTGSDLWRKKFQQLMVSYDDAKILWNKFTKGKKVIPINQLPFICDQFKLHLLIMSEDLSFHFKYQDVIKGVAENKLNNGNQELEREAYLNIIIKNFRFLKWWFIPIEEYQINW